ncbi:MAG TPA: c-type cytochrome [Polyangiales bacterium]|nr:c-type cytochrome [Polyangiales bacterium]
MIPVDERPVIQALTSPPAISGGTLAISPEGQQAVAADPDRDRISIVDLKTQTVRHIELEQGDEPGRVVVESASRAYVALRGAGAIATVDLVNGALLDRTQVCSAPRGMALAKPQLTAAPTEAASNLWLHVACADGRLVTLNTTGTQSVVRDLKLNADLRDVMVSDSEPGLRVSTFKTSELLTLDAAGAVVSRDAAPELNVAVQESEGDSVVTRERPMQPHLAWRSVRAPDGSVMMLHQVSANEEIDITRRSDNPEQASPYGGGGFSGCQGVVLATVSKFGSRGAEASIALDGNVLDVDMAVAPNGSELAIVEAGTADADAPRPKVVFADGNIGASFGSVVAPQQSGSPVSSEFVHESRVFRMPTASPMVSNLFGSVRAKDGVATTCGTPGEVVMVPGQATAVAYTRESTMVIQSREPALLTVMGPGGSTNATVIPLGGESVRDTGHDIFHRNSGGGVACASCHAEGAEDGHVWNFTGQGLRRTQALHVGLQGTAPFHWAGDESDLHVLMEDVFVGRMGGVHQSDPRVDSLSRFLFALQPPQAALAAEDPAAVRGKALFESTAGCASCHVGAKFTDNKSYDVGTGHGERLQVPSLRGVAYRAPFLHTGCAKTLRDRFAAECGGSKHGNVAQLQPAQIDDLVAYLQTL